MQRVFVSLHCRIVSGGEGCTDSKSVVVTRGSSWQSDQSLCRINADLHSAMD